MPSTSTVSAENRRILIIDDNPDIHRDITKVLQSAAENSKPPVSAHVAALLEVPHLGAKESAIQPFELSSAYQGEHGLNLADAASAAGQPFAAAFVDGRMPPGWDGIETIQHLWKSCPDLQVVICTAYADYTWEQIMRILGGHDNLVILKKPFDVIEVQQVAEAMVRRWNRNQHAQMQIEELANLVRNMQDPDTTPPSDPHRFPAGHVPAGGPERTDLIIEHARVLSRQIHTRVRDSKCAIVGRLATTLRPHHAQLGAFGKKLPDFLSQLSTQLDRERISLTQLVGSLQHNLDRLRTTPSNGGPRTPGG